ncbi:DRTGG domain-containing protein [Anaerobranca gottschalkii]|uniref:Predicted transcriptional regulator containing CBS domains n=1 Tax=Anaerobranca gottschalkii DSM 13577 TaxID=1120990 RepID=A0A1I0AYU5_9FIRM|nr:DRTGG domain-containing protein [Anaerobranca gottschalkii]SES99552.1 Predicted transcriptional regulator containing CBS domains [Anaerobranca gottschalkii DSM 13577]
MSETKHEKIIEYIESLSIGSKISVRRIAKDLKVSEGTAYRAIKEAENVGLVSTMPRVGTIRIKKQGKGNIEKLTFAEIINIVEGSVLGGRGGLHKTLNKFVIGAMEIDAMVKYIEKDNLLIVGNRVEAQKKALELGAAVLITGGFDTEDEIKKMADEKELPVIQTTYDTFTIATLINRAIYDRLIKKEIVLVEDILVSNPDYLTLKATVADWKQMVKETTHTRFPVVDEHMKVVGIVTTKDVAGADLSCSIEKLMTKNPVTVTLKTSLAAVAHTMVWEGIELIPVVENKKLIGVVSRQDVMKALQQGQKQPQVSMTINDAVLSGFKEEEIPGGIRLIGEITPMMTNHIGGASSGALMILLTNAAYAALRKAKFLDTVVENVTVYFFKPIQIESPVSVEAKILDMGRKTGKVDLTIYSQGSLVCKSLLSAQILDR